MEQKLVIINWLLLYFAQSLRYLSAYNNQIDKTMGSDHPKSTTAGQILKSGHPYFQNATIGGEGDKKYIQALFPTQDKEYESWKKIVSDPIHPLNHQFLFLPTNTGFQNDKELCSNTGTAVNVYPYFPTVLADQIKRRKSDSSYFKQSELWYLFYALLAASVDLKNHSTRIGDIGPHNVFINQKQQAKIGNVFSTPNEKSSFARLLDPLNIQHTILLPPQDIAEAKKKAIDNRSNPKSQVFSIGATVISAGILDDLSSVYDYKNLNFNSQEFKKKTETWLDHSKYSQIFKSIIQNLVNQIPDRRINIEQLWKFVSNYSSNIKNKQQFIITSPPDNLQKNVSVIRSRVQ